MLCATTRASLLRHCKPPSLPSPGLADTVVDPIASADAGLSNPFLGSGGGSPPGLGMQDLASSLQDPKILQDALKELQVKDL